MKPNPSDTDCRRLWQLLADGQWHKSKDIDMPHRLIRAVCQAKPEHFLSSQRGYKLTKHATKGEIEAAANDLRSRIRCLQARADALDGVIYERYQQRMAI